MTHSPTSSPTEHGSLGEVIAWLNHEASLLEILAYRLDGLTNVLRTARHSMICTAASDVESVHDQLIRAAVHRDLALLETAPGLAGLTITARELEVTASEPERHALTEVRSRIEDVLSEVEQARSACMAAAETYRPADLRVDRRRLEN